MSKDETTSYDTGSHDHKNQNTIPTKYIDALIAGELASPNVLLDKINDNYKTLDGKATTREYIFKTGIGIIIVLALKLLIDWGMYKQGLCDGYAKKKNEICID